MSETQRQSAIHFSQYIKLSIILTLLYSHIVYSCYIAQHQFSLNIRNVFLICLICSVLFSLRLDSLYLPSVNLFFFAQLVTLAHISGRDIKQLKCKMLLISVTCQVAETVCEKEILLQRIHFTNQEHNKIHVCIWLLLIK